MLKQALKRTQKKWTGAVRLESARQAGRQDTERTRSQTFLLRHKQQQAPEVAVSGSWPARDFLLAGLELARRRVDAEPRLSVCTALESVRVCVCVPVGLRLTSRGGGTRARNKSCDVMRSREYQQWWELGEGRKLGGAG